MSSKKVQPKPSNIAEYKQGVLKGLTFKQRRFAEYYIISGNKGLAAAKAGYSAKTSSLQGRMLYRNPIVRAYIEFLIAGQDEEIMASVDEAKRRMSKAIRGELEEEVVVMVKTKKISYDKKGKRVTVQKERPEIFKRKISVRDQIEAGKFYVNIMDKSNIIGEETKSTDARILDAMKQRREKEMIKPQLSNEFEFEEDEAEDEKSEIENGK